jgi:fused signal recognition particle receptor
VIRGALNRFREGLRKTREGLVGGLRGMFGGRVKLDQETLDRIEELLISADMGVQSAVAITGSIEKRLKEEGGEASLEAVLAVIRADVVRILSTAKPRVRPPSWDDEAVGGKSGKKKKGKAAQAQAEAEADEPAAAGPRVIFVVGVNGTGKTTTVGKLARVLVADGRRVVLGAADTFRAAAADQLQSWAARVGAQVVRGAEGADPASVAFDAVTEGIAAGADVVVIDTAGRLHTKTGLMDELGKVKRVVEKRTAVDEVLLVLDATIGQNGLAQARVFADVVDITGVVLTKLDGTAKGGIVFRVQQELGVPVKLVGLGEGPDDLAPSEPAAFVDALLG